MKLFLSLILFIFFLSGPILSQSLITKLLFEQSHAVFKGKVTKTVYQESNAEGSSFSVRLNVEHYYKGNNGFQKLSFGVDKPDVIDLELDTMIMDYGFQFDNESSYIFFTNKIVESQRANTGYTWLVEPGIEAIPFSIELDELIQSFQGDYKFSSSRSASIAYTTMMSNSDSIFIAEVSSVKEKKNEYQLKLKTLLGMKKILIPRLSCVCKEGSLMIGKSYIFYVEKIGENKMRIMDEWLGIIEATDYEKNRFRNGLRIPYFEDIGIMGY